MIITVLGVLCVVPNIYEFIWVIGFGLFLSFLHAACVRVSERETCFTREAEVYFSRYPTCCYKHGFFFSSVKLLSILNCKMYSPFK